MTNEEKAFELSSVNKHGFSVEESNAAYNAALEMAEWKEQQMIDKAVEWLKNRTMSDLCLSIDNKPLVNEFIESFKQAMMEE